MSDYVKSTFIQIVTNTLLNSELEFKDIVGVIMVDFTKKDIDKLKGSNGILKKKKRKFFDYVLSYEVSLKNKYESGINFWTYELNIPKLNQASSYIFFGDEFDDFRKKAKSIEKMLNDTRYQRINRMLN